MYTPKAFVEERPEVITGFLAAHPMAQLVTMTGDGLVATPMPMLYELSAEGLGSLVGHFARANRQWADAVVDVEALAIFTGLVAGPLAGVRTDFRYASAGLCGACGHRRIGHPRSNASHCAAARSRRGR